MFGLPVYRHFIQGSAIRTWNCVTHIANSIWYKLYPAKPTIMPRSRRRYHSRSRSRSRSGSHDRDRDVKRRKIDGYDDSLESEAIESTDRTTMEATEDNGTLAPTLEEVDKSMDIAETDKGITKKSDAESAETPDHKIINEPQELANNFVVTDVVISESSISPNESVVFDVTQESVANSTLNSSLDESIVESEAGKSGATKNIIASVTPNKPLTPKQLQKRHESVKKKLERQKDREERERQKNAEKEERERQKNAEKEEREKKKQQERDEKNQLKLKLKQEKEDQRLEKQKELEQTQKEKEQKRKEKEELEEHKRLKRQQEMDEKNKEKQKEIEKKQKSSAMFVNFFTKKKTEETEKSAEDKKPEEQQNYFMPFELKSDMRLAPAQRRELSVDEQKFLEDQFTTQQVESLYLEDLKSGKPRGKQNKTWPYEDDDIMVVDDIGETIAESHKSKMRVKFLKFDENQRPAYYGTWRKRSSLISPRVPYRMDSKLLNYDVDSDDEWEAEGEGESLKGSDDEEEKEQEPDQDYEVDNEFFVPHCYLSDDEVDDEVNAKLNPELHKAKLKLLKNEFDAEMKSQTQRLKTIIYGCVWANKNDKDVDKDPMRRHMDLFACISNEFPITIPKQSDVASNKTKTIKNKSCPLDKDHLIEFLKCIHGNVNKRKTICREFLAYLTEVDDVSGCKQSLASLGRQMIEMAQWSKCQAEGLMLNKFCWNVKEEVIEKYGIVLNLPNKWKT